MRPILLVGATKDFGQRLYGSLNEDLRGRVRVWPHEMIEGGGMEAVDYSDPAVLVLGPSLVDLVAFRIADRVHGERPEVGVIVVTRSDSAPREASPVGVAAVLSSESTPEEIRRAVASALRHHETAGPRSPEGVPAGVARSGQVTSVVSPKGGAGKTVVCINVAVGLAAAAPRGVVILDLDLQFGDVAYGLGLKPRHTLFDVISSPGDLDITTLKVFLAHHTSDLYALCAPDDPARGEMVPVEDVVRVIELLTAEFDHVVIDTCAGLTEHTLAAVELSSDVIFIADMDVPSVRHLTKVVAAMDRLGITDHRRHFVLNRADARVGLSMPAAAEKAGLPIHIELPTTKGVPVSVNQGKPLIHLEPKSQMARRLRELIERIDAHRAPGGAARPLSKTA